MIRIAALNEESEEEDVSTEEGGVTREALEEIALQQYARTLELQRKGNSKDALSLLRDLLDTELLDPVDKDTASRPMVNLKYLCYKNIASISARLGNEEDAVENYLKASEYDATDITLWYRLGCISLKLDKFDLALYAFQRGVECNTRHWLCLDKLITILLGLGEYNDCIFTIHNALQLDPDYLRGRAYRKHIFTEYPYIQDFVSSYNPIYKWTPDTDKDIEGEDCEKLLQEAKIINESYTKQVFDNKVVERLPILPLNKPIETWSWISLGESLVDMHMHISEHLLSHACVITVCQPELKAAKGTRDEIMDVDVVVSAKTATENVQNDEKVTVEKGSEEKVDKVANEAEKMDLDENVQIQDANNKVTSENKKTVTRRRGSSLSFLEQWEWCTKRRSNRKKTSNRPDQNETICSTLKRLLPKHLVTDENYEQTNKVKEFKGDESLDTMDLYKLFEEKEKCLENNQQEECNGDTETYFGTEKEQTQVQQFIQKYVDSACDIITLLDDYVETLSQMWEVLWPDGLGDIFMEANWCSRQHSDPPLGYDKTENVLKTFININLIHLEMGINKLLEEDDDKKGNVETELIDLLKILCSRRESLGESALHLTIRFLWVKSHSLLYKGEVEFALDSLYYIVYELNCLDEEGNTFALKVPNFTKWAMITKNNCVELIKSLERNKRLSTVLHLYETGKYEDVLVILQDSFKYCQHQASKQEWNSMALDWAVQLVTLLESLWALNNTEQCFTWAAVCLHEAIKQYALCEPGGDGFEQWSLTLTKVLMCLEHILNQEGSAYLDILSDKTKARMVQDVIQAIVQQLDDSNNSADMPLNTIAPWILLHYVFQREEDCGRMTAKSTPEEVDIPASLMILFIAHENLGKKGWCSVNESKLLYFTLRAVIPRLRSPALSLVVESLTQYLEQCVFCLFGHPTKKTKVRYLVEHNAAPCKLDWEWAQQIFELYRPEEMPEFNSYRLGSITADTEQLFQGMLALAPPGLDPHPHSADVIAYIEGRKNKLADVSIELPYKMRDIYYLLADYYLKNNETVKALKYYGYDIVISKNRFDSWAGMALARGSLLETKLNSCETFKTEMEYLTRATAVEGCFKKALEIEFSHSMLWIEYGAFVYGVHSFCSRMLKQASESLSMESFEVLENRKEAMLDTAHRCFINAHRQWMAESQADDKGPQDERWLHYYMLGKISEKKNENPQKYLDYYQKASKFLQENNATYPTKINYNNPQNLSVEALEIHYRVHASILKYIEQHENKVIYMTAGKSFKDCLDQCGIGPFGLKKKNNKELNTEKDQNNESIDMDNKTVDESVKEATLKRTHSGEEEDNETKKIKLTTPGNESEIEAGDKMDATSDKKIENAESEVVSVPVECVNSAEKSDNPTIKQAETVETTVEDKSLIMVEDGIETKSESNNPPEIGEQVTVVTEITNEIEAKSDVVKEVETEIKTQESNASNAATSKSTSSESSSDSSSDDSSSDSSSDSSQESDKPPEEMTQDAISEIVSICLENLEDCVSRFPQHYKALYRLAHFHFYYKKDKNVNRCRDLMLGSFTTKNGGKLQGLFCERKNSNFFNGIWRIPASEVDRPGSFASHMSRCVLITMEVLKDIDDNKTLLDLSLHLRRTPDADKKYLRDSERIELSQQALSLCIRSIKGQLGKFSKGYDPSKNILGKKELSNLMLDIYRAYQRIQKHIPTKVPTFSALLIDSYKIYSGKSDIENILEKSIKKCQSIISNMKQQAQQQNVQNETQALPPPPPAPAATVAAPAPPPPKKVKPIVPIIPATSFLPHMDPPTFPAVPNSYLPYLPMMDNQLLQAMSSMRGLGAANPAYQIDFFSQMFNMDSAYMQQKRYTQNISKSKTPKANVAKSTNIVPTVKPPVSTPKTSVPVKTTVPGTQSFTNYPNTQVKKNTQVKNIIMPTPVPSVPVSHTQSMYAVNQSCVQPAHTTPVSPGPGTSNTSGTVQPAHQSTASTVNAALHAKPPAPHQQVSPGKTLQEKLAERQKQNPAVSKPNTETISRAPASAFSGKIPPALTISKTTAVVKAPTNEEQKQYKDSTAKGSREAKKLIQFNTPVEKLALPKNVIDSNEVIVLDDD